jgi:hypothetical protein
MRRGGIAPAAAALALAALLGAAGSARAQTPVAGGQAVWILEPMNCDPGLRPQPDGPYAALVFCENALGAYLAVVRLAPLEKTVEGAWSPRALIWQEEPWATDITSFAWTPDGGRLFVATAEGAGSGGLYELDLGARRARQVAPKDSAVTAAKPGPGYVIDRLDRERQVLHYRALPWNVPAGVSVADSVALAPAPPPAPPAPAPKAKTASKRK